MWRIRKPKRTGQAMLKNDVGEPPNFEMPKFMARQLLQHLRLAHIVCDEIERMFPLLPPDQQRLYAHLINLKLQPAFIDLVKLIDVSEEHGLFTADEASALRAGKVRDIHNSIPDLESSGQDGHEKAAP